MTNSCIRVPSDAHLLPRGRPCRSSPLPTSPASSLEPTASRSGMPRCPRSGSVSRRPGARPGHRHPPTGRQGAEQDLARHLPSMSLSEARAAARELMADPAGELARREAAAGLTVAETIEQYIAGTRRRGRRAWREVQQILQKELAPWAHRPLAEIRRRDLAELIDGVVARAPSMGSRLHSHIKRMFRWCLEVDLLDSSPAAGHCGRQRCQHHASACSRRRSWQQCGRPRG